jgi:hypothetical protein
MNMQTLYEQDFNVWVQTHVALLKEARFSELDVNHLVEELEELGKKHEHELVSRFIILIAHLLKWQYQPTMQCNSWLSTIIEQRIQVEYLLELMPSLKNKLEDATIKAYPKAVKIAVKETGLSLAIFPSSCAYCYNELLDENFYPGNAQ